MRKISVFGTVGRTYAFAFRRYFTILGVVWLPLVVLGVGETVLGWTLSQANNVIQNGPKDAMSIQFGQTFFHFLDTLSQQLGPLLSSVLRGLLVLLSVVAIVSVGIVKAALGKRKGLHAVYLWFGLEEFLVAATYALLIVIYCAYAFFALVGGTNIAPFAAFFLLALFYVSMRLSFFAVPVAVAERRFGMFESFRLSRRNWWRMFAIGMLTWIPATILLPFLIAAYADFVFTPAARLISGLAGPSLDSFVRQSSAGRYISSLLFELPLFSLAPIFGALVWVPGAFAYRELVPDEFVERKVGIHSPKSVDELTFGGVLAQFKKDLFDKEVQSAATYSYLWLADQMGHIGVGLVLTVVFGLWLQAFGPLTSDRLWWVFGAATAVCLFFEVEAYRAYATKSTGVFQPDNRLLAENAGIAFLYMLLGVQLGVAWDRTLVDTDANHRAGILWDAHTVLIITLFLALIVAYRWVRQKIVWQKAGMPFLFRLANIDSRAVTRADAEKLEEYLEDYLLKKDARAAHTPVIILTGPIRASKTELACGIGTHGAFRNLTVRYITFNKLSQMAAAKFDDLGPPNIRYWKWEESEVVIIDDVHSGSHDNDYADLEEFKAITGKYDLPGRFSGRITVWVIGPKEEQELPAWEDAIRNVCRCRPEDGMDAEPEVMTIRLQEPQAA